MATFILDTPIETTEDKIEVTIAPDNPLQLGRHRFQLVVVDDSGNSSEADVVEVRVIDTENPTADLSAPERVPFNNSFPLSGRNSSDVGGGRVVRYIWTYLGRVPDVIVGPIIRVGGEPVGPGTPVTPVTPR